jgi:membrane protein implicated in regulation of membrane protease activity
MTIAAIVLAILGIIATALVGLLVHKKTSKLLRLIHAILIARVTPKELSEMKRLIEDIERTGEKRGTVVQRADGTWGIDWAMVVGGGTVKPTGTLRTRLIK